MPFRIGKTQSPEAIPVVSIMLKDTPEAQDVDGNPAPLIAKYHFYMADKNGNRFQESGGPLSDQYTDEELKPLFDFLKRLRKDIEDQIL